VIATVGTRQCLQAARDFGPDTILFIDEQADVPSQEISRNVYQNMPGTATIILTKGARQEDAQYLRQALLAGARDVLSLPPLLDTLVTSLQQAQQLEKGRRKRRVGPATRTSGGGRLIAVYGPKGGVGRSIFASNLAIWLAKNATPSRVVLCDLDLQFGDQTVLLDMEPSRSIADLLSVIDELTPDVVESTMVSHPSGLRVLLAPPDPRQAKLMDAESVRKILIALRAYYDLTIVDTTASLSDTNLTALEFADLILQICTPDLLSVRRTRIALGLYEEWGIPLDTVRLVVNRTQKHSEIKPEEISALFEREIFGQVPDDYLFLQPYVNSGVPFIDTREKSSFITSFQAIANKLMATTPEAA
jgi:pilus assembly protein CpaE